MGDSQENNRGKSKDKDDVTWTMEETNELLHLLVDAMNRGMRDANGSLSKQTVERLILPELNAKTRFPKTYSHYLSRMKWFKNQYNMMSTLMRHNSGFAGHGNDPENELFNLRYASLRNVIERIFGVFKSRFTIFKSAPPFPFKAQAELVLACAALHNFLRKECRSDEFPVEPTDESSSSSSVLPNHEDNNYEPIVQTQEQEREDANLWRTSISSDM
ncbi:uncharacterized protein LOC123904698 [Trifolium pratense]|uniref:Uncharacterized protein n=1 Tax=Trifolium pratense TaxID=57577 RepID=A0ACB0K1E4_TRIPR|nr:uncharacterized protein LOC123904698 [Trifolium pratense]CAJ2650427.1 unnamed protein product [Trifolium pratense]